MTYEAWRISYQSSEQAARAAYSGLQSTSTRLHEAAVACANAEAERDALRAKIAEMEQQEPARLVTATAYRWRYRGAIKWQYGELTEETVMAAKEHNHEVQSLGVLPGAHPAQLGYVPASSVHSVIHWLRNGCDPMEAADELEMLTAAPEAKP